MKRLTSERCSGIKTGYWSPAKKDELVQRLGKYEDTGLEPEEIRQQSGWRDAKADPPAYGEPVIVARPYPQYGKGKYKVEQGCRDLNGWWRVYGTRTTKVTHWMPLPEPPKEGT